MPDWKPRHYPSVSPYLICADAERTIAFMEAAFGGVLLRRFNRSDGSLMHAEVRIDDSVVMVGGGATPAQQSAPHVHLYVPDVATCYSRALAAGGRMVTAPSRKRDDDDFRGGIIDTEGTTWWIASQGHTTVPS